MGVRGETTAVVKDTTTVVFNGRGLPWPDIAEIFRAIGRDDLVEQGEAALELYSLKLPTNSPLLTVLRRELRGHGLEWAEVVNRTYTPAELRRAELLQLVISKAPRGFGGPSYGTSYDLGSGCSACGTAAEQTSALIVRASDLPRSGSIATTYDGELLVSAELAQALREARLSGLRLGEVRSQRGALLPWRQVGAERALPAISPLSRGVVREDPCSVCGRDGFFNTPAEPTELAYEGLDPVGLDDVSCSWEHFGKSRLRQPLSDSFFAPCLLIVKQRFFRLCSEHKLRGFSFVPVRLTSAREELARLAAELPVSGLEAYVALEQRFGSASEHPAVLALPEQRRLERQWGDADLNLYDSYLGAA